MKLGGGRDLEERYYTLEGKFVSREQEVRPEQCTGIRVADQTKGQILSNLKLIPDNLLITYYAVWVVGLIGYTVVIVSAHKLLHRWNIKKLSRHTVPFVIGFVMSTGILGLFIVSSELHSLATWGDQCSLEFHVAFKLIFLALSVFLLISLPPIVIILSHICKNGTKTCNQLFLNYGIIYLMFCFPIFPFFWVFSCSFALLLLGFAYPLNTLALVVVHLAFVFAFTVAFAVIVAEVISELEKRKRRKFDVGFFLFLITLCAALIIVAILLYIGIIVGYLFTIVQGFVTTDGAQAVVSFLPSLALFLIGWLIKKNFFGEIGIYS